MINTSDRRGGAAVAAYRLKRALSDSGTEVKLIVRDKMTEDPQVVSVDTGLLRRLRNRFRFLWERLVIFRQNGFSRKNLFAVSIADTGVDLSRMPEIRDADIIHLHWINQGLLSLRGLEKLLALGKPVVWTLHDMWALTGICHHAWTCHRYETECGKCPFLGSRRENDLSSRVFWRKKIIYDRFPGLRLVPVSRWLEDKSRAGALTWNLPAVAIPNPIDTGFFRPGDRQEARRTLGFPETQKILLMGAARIDDPVKGFSSLKEALHLLDPDIRKDILLVLFGGIKNEKEALTALPVEFVWRQTVSDPQELRKLYRCADLFLAPSMEDNLPNTVMESLACGTPVAGFRTGGIPEMVDHRENGYLADRGDNTGLARGIEWVLNHPHPEELSDRARLKILTCFTIEGVAKQYLGLYRSLMK